MKTPTNLSSFLIEVNERIEAQLQAKDFHADQLRLLRTTLQQQRRHERRNPLGSPLSILYLIARAHQCCMGPKAQHVAAFCMLYILSLDLFDDVQDDDLAAGTHADEPVAIAINSAITLGFLAIEHLRAAMELEPHAEQRMAYFELFNRVSIKAAIGQHRDLLGVEGAATPEQVLAMQQGKTSSVILLTECGGLLGGCSDEQQRGYRQLGYDFAAFIQVRDDLRDIYGKSASPDLMTGKNSYPIAWFFEHATGEQRQRFEQLSADLPQSMPSLRRLLYEADVVRHCAEALQHYRRAIHRQVAHIAPGSASLRLLLDVVDGLAGSVYQPPAIAATSPMWRPRGIWHERVRAELARFARRTRSLGLSSLPKLRPWHQPQWMYLPAKDTIFYPDIEGLAEHTLPFQAALIGSDDRDEVAAMIHGQVSTMLAHEMFHRWRDSSGRLTSDHWHEEWAANRLAVAYALRFEPEALARSLAIAKQVIARHPDRLDEHALAILDHCDVFREDADGYAMDLIGMAVTTLEMVRRQYLEAPQWEQTAEQLLSLACSRSA